MPKADRFQPFSRREFLRYRARFSSPARFPSKLSRSRPLFLRLESAYRHQSRSVYLATCTILSICQGICVKSNIKKIATHRNNFFQNFFKVPFFFFNSKFVKFTKLIPSLYDEFYVLWSNRKNVIKRSLINTVKYGFYQLGALFQSCAWYPFKELIWKREHLSQEITFCFLNLMVLVSSKTQLETETKTRETQSRKGAMR